MALQQEILAAFEELDSLDIEPIENGSLTEAKLKVLVTLPLIYKIKEKLVSNEIISEEVKETLMSTSVGDLEKSMKWLDSCLVNRGLHLRANREKVWTLYHQNLLLNLSAMTTTTKSREASAIFALHMMKELVSANYAESKPTKLNTEEISENEEEVISYIAGYLLKKTKFNYPTEVQALTSSQPIGLTSLMNRGGLTQANDDFISVVRELEVTFRQLDDKSVNFALYNNAVCKQNIASDLFNMLEDADSSVEKKEKFFVRIVHLFFTVRAHQKCRNQVEKSIRLTKTSQKSKALRDSL